MFIFDYLNLLMMCFHVYFRRMSCSIRLKEIKKKFTNNKIVTLKDTPDFSKIEYAIIWDLPDEIFQKLINVRLLFSMGAGVDHIITLPSLCHLKLFG